MGAVELLDVVNVLHTWSWLAYCSQKCELVVSGNSLDAEIRCCAMMVESIEKLGRQMRTLMNVSLRMVHFRRVELHASVCRNRALHPGAVL